MRVYPLNRWESGTYKRECDVCGFDYLRNQLKKRYDGFIVCDKDWEPEPRDWKKQIIRAERPIKID
jgi:hypothetical protein